MKQITLHRIFAPRAVMAGLLTTLGTHGAYVTLGLFWGLFIILQVKKRCLNPGTANKSFISFTKLSNSL